MREQARTVAAEVCMEARLNDQAYSALKKLDKAGELRDAKGIENPLESDVVKKRFYCGAVH